MEPDVDTGNGAGTGVAAVLDGAEDPLPVPVDAGVCSALESLVNCSCLCTTAPVHGSKAMGWRGEPEGKEKADRSDCMMEERLRPTEAPLAAMFAAADASVPPVKPLMLPVGAAEWAETLRLLALSRGEPRGEGEERGGRAPPVSRALLMLSRRPAVFTAAAPAVDAWPLCASLAWLAWLLPAVTPVGEGEGEGDGPEPCGLVTCRCCECWGRASSIGDPRILSAPACMSPCPRM